MILDIETSGLNFNADRIIEIALIKVANDEIVDGISYFVKTDKKIPKSIQMLTGIANEIIDTEGLDEQDILVKISNFIKNDTVVGYNIKFDLSFIYMLAERNKKNIIIKEIKDVLQIAHQKIENLPNYKLETVAKYFLINTDNVHRAYSDCMTTYKIYSKLNELPDTSI